MSERRIEVGIIGGGIGGLAAAIAISQAGARVTVLEAASEIAEIGAGIQMTPNVSRLLIKWGVDKIIGDDLVRHEEMYLRKKDGTVVGHSAPDRIERELGFPWWVVHRHHLLTGLLKTVERNRCNVTIDSQVTDVQHKTSDGKVRVKTHKGSTYVFDLVIGADGLSSVVRKTLFPDVSPKGLTNNSSYRATIPYSEVRKVPELLSIVSKPNMDVWMGPNGYVISYPISNGEIFNLVFSHHRPYQMLGAEEVDFDDMRKEYADYDPRVRKIIDMIDPSTIKRWPLVQTGPLDSWSSPSKNCVLMGDSAHSMVNHMAQGAATSMEDGAFLAVCLRECVLGNMSVPDAVNVYEAGRMPKSRMKQQVSFLNGAIWTLPEGPLADARDQAMASELGNKPILRSPNLYIDPVTVLEVYGYDVEGHAEEAVREFKRGGRLDKREHITQGREMDELTSVERWRADRTLNWFLPKEVDWRPVKPGANQIRTGHSQQSKL
ncbi:MAG: hypothetical protein M1828_004285 [Chrysothrix sp. TS-e1954]|nr:MAG: hypothetical protein M1828_004285 [Chrysothrix sp. TS-e1954]